MNAWWGSCSGCRVRCSHQTVGDFSSRRCLLNKKKTLCGDSVCLFVVKRSSDLWSFQLKFRAVGQTFVSCNSARWQSYLRSLMKFCTCCPYLLTDLGEIWCNRCIGIALNSCHVNHCSGSQTYGCKWDFSCLLLHFSSVLDKIKYRWPYKCTECEFPESQRSEYMSYCAVLCLSI